jgi:hypothetical protein
MVRAVTWMGYRHGLLKPHSRPFSISPGKLAVCWQSSWHLYYRRPHSLALGKAGTTFEPPQQRLAQ